MFASGFTARPIADLLPFLQTRTPTPVTRFAPAPTGALHLGHVVNAIYVWGLARALGGSVVLRIEDHDRQRSRPAHERGMLDDLEWLGLDADVHPIAAFRAGTCEGRQSERERVYREALAPLVAAGMIYGCDCTRASQSPAGNVESAAGERRYPGTCRTRGIPLGDGVGWRLRMEPGNETFEDGLVGCQTQEPSEQCGDLLLRDRLGNWTYQCVAAIDDAAQGIDLVIRGQDLLASTGRQIRLARLVGRRDPAAFVHHPLVMKSATQKLSKSDGDSGIRELRAAGMTAEDMIGRAARLAGLSRATRLSVADLPSLFLRR